MKNNRKRPREYCTLKKIILLKENIKHFFFFENVFRILIAIYISEYLKRTGIK